MSRAFNDGFNVEGVFVGHEEVEENDLREELNTFIRAGQKQHTSVGDTAMPDSKSDMPPATTDEVIEWVNQKIIDAGAEDSTDPAVLDLIDAMAGLLELVKRALPCKS